MIHLSNKDSQLFFDTLKNPPAPCVRIVIDAKHQQAKAYYHQFGFIGLLEQLNNIFLPLPTIAKSLRNTDETF